MDKSLEELNKIVGRSPRHTCLGNNCLLSGLTKEEIKHAIKNLDISKLKHKAIR